MLDEDFDENDSNDQPEDALTINKAFAEKFESRERSKELARGKYLLADDGDDESSDSESDEDDDGELLDPALDAKIVQTINSIRKKDPKIYDKSTVWFNQTKSNDESDEDEANEDTSHGKKSKKKHFKDVLREQLLKHGADIDDSDNSKYKLDNQMNKKSLAYDEEQERIRKAFLKEAVVPGGQNSDDDDDDDDDDDSQDFFSVKAKDPAQQAKDEEELKRALDELKALGGDEGTVTEAVDKDAFLVDYISKKKWKFEPLAERKGSSIAKVDDSDEDKSVGGVDYEQDEEELDKMEMFESKYNFRFEELQGASASGGAGADRGSSLTSTRGGLGLGANAVQVVGHARNVEGSVRRVEDKRKQQREERKERKEKERRQKEAELRRLKNLKKQELQERLKHICEVGGLKEMGLDEVEAALDEDWDEEKYEAMMQARFGADYYDQDEDDEAFRKQLDKGKSSGRKEAEDGDDQMEDEFDQPDLDDGDEDEDESGVMRLPDQKGKVAGAPNKAQLSDMMDEMYKLEYEDIVAGMPCRFKYRQVPKEDFGLTAEEILLAEDAELNQFVSLKKISAYRDSSAITNDGKVAKKRKRLRVALRERLKKEAEEAAAAGLTQKGTKPVKSKKDGAGDSGSADENEDNDNNDTEDQKSSRRRRRRRKGDGKDAQGTEMETERHSDKRQRSSSNEEGVDEEVDSRPPRPQQKQKHQKNNDKQKNKKKDAAGGTASASSKPSEKQRRMNLYD